MRYFKLEIQSTITQQLLNHALNAEHWQNKNSFDYVNVPLDIVIQDSTLKMFLIKFRANPVIFRMKPQSFYRFHIDEKRKCAVNMLLAGYDSSCYFGNVTEFEDILDNIEELIYEPNTFYLLNTKQKHAVMNFSNTRYMFSMGINDFDYEFVLKNITK